MTFMNSPIAAAFAPGEDEVVGRMVSPTSSSRLMTFGENVSVSVLTELLRHPVRKASAPTIVPPKSKATLDNASLLFILVCFVPLT